MNYIVEYEDDRGDYYYDIDRFAKCNLDDVHKTLARLFASTFYAHCIRYHIWKADENCYKTVGKVPIESGGVDSLLAQYGE